MLVSINSDQFLSFLNKNKDLIPLRFYAFKKKCHVFRINKRVFHCWSGHKLWIQPASAGYQTKIPCPNVETPFSNHSRSVGGRNTRVHWGKMIRRKKCQKFFEPIFVFKLFNRYFTLPFYLRTFRAMAHLSMRKKLASRRSGFWRRATSLLFRIQNCICFHFAIIDHQHLASNCQKKWRKSTFWEKSWAKGHAERYTLSMNIARATHLHWSKSNKSRFLIAKTINRWTRPGSWRA